MLWLAYTIGLTLTKGMVEIFGDPSHHTTTTGWCYGVIPTEVGANEGACPNG